MTFLTAAPEIGTLRIGTLDAQIDAAEFVSGGFKVRAVAGTGVAGSAYGKACILAPDGKVAVLGTADHQVGVKPSGVTWIVTVTFSLAELEASEIAWETTELFA